MGCKPTPGPFPRSPEGLRCWLMSHLTLFGLLVTVGQFSGGCCAAPTIDSVEFLGLQCPPTVRGSGPAVGTQARTGPCLPSWRGRPSVLPHLRGPAPSGCAALSSHYHLTWTPLWAGCRVTPARAPTCSQPWKVLCFTVSKH